MALLLAASHRWGRVVLTGTERGCIKERDGGLRPLNRELTGGVGSLGVGLGGGGRG